jgi:serine carboxypeptidase-like clade 2
MAAYLGVWISLALCMITVNFQYIDGQNAWQSEKKDAASKHLVTNLPGQPKVEFNQYAGYVTVHEEHGRALFYWFFEAALLKKEKPLVLWLNGGPGCSSVGYGATQEIGPFLVDGNGTDLIFNKYSWNQEANLLFVESPVGVGFSYSNTSSDYNMLGDNITASDTYTFLQNWLNRFPEYRRHDFYIAGESYAGKYVPELAELIYDLNNASTDTHINLKGFMVGNPETHDGHDLEGFVDYAWSHAIVSDETHRMIKKNCDFYPNDPWSDQNCRATLMEIQKQYNEIDIFSLYTPTCVHKNSTPANTVSEQKKLKFSTTMVHSNVFKV